MAKNFKNAKKARRNYPVVFTVNWYKQQKDVEWVKKNGLGCADSVLLTTIVNAEDGGVLVHFSSIDGKTGNELNDQELFKLWGLLADRLSKSKTLSTETTKFLASAWKPLADAMSKVSGKGYMS
jgi:GTP-dependent phosphoenolpyruvate carboxykinase